MRFFNHGNHTVTAFAVTVPAPAALLYVLLVFYGSAGPVAGALSAVLFTATVCLAANLYRYIPVQGSFPYIRTVYVAAAFFIAFDLALAVYVISYKGMTEFGADFLLYAVSGIYLWIIISRCGNGATQEENTVRDEPPVDAQPSPDPVRITVKKGNSLHIIEKQDIIYIAAMGDYVSVVTPAGRFVKEGTMGWYENALRDGFVRIHRSTIVNVSSISAIELYGKHTYNIKLDTGETLRASAAGYRALRDRLGS